MIRRIFTWLTAVAWPIGAILLLGLLALSGCGPSEEEHDKAIADYTEAIRLNPKDADAYYNRGLAYWNKGKFDKAIAEYTEAIRLNPKLAEAYYSRGFAYRNNGDLAKAEADFAKAKELGLEQQ